MADKHETKDVRLSGHELVLAYGSASAPLVLAVCEVVWGKGVLNIF